MTVRPLLPSDRVAVNRLHRDVWWPERSQAGWDWLDANPARTALDAPSGWVAVDGRDQAQAFVGNLVQKFWLDDKPLFGATGFSIIVPHAARGASRQLIQSVMRQSGVFSSYTFNANPQAARLYPRLGLRPWPPRTDGLKLAWIVDPVVCFRSRALRELARRAPALAAPEREHFMTRRLRMRDGKTAADQKPVATGPVEALRDLTDGSDYGRFWNALRAQGRLVADRSPETLRWRLSDPDLTDPPVMLAYRTVRGVTGYAMALLTKGNPIEPAVLEIIDLQSLDDEPQAIPALMRELLTRARRMGAAKVRLQVVCEETLRRLGPWATSARREGGWGHCHAVFHPGAPSPVTWAPTPFDGDYGVCQRPAPLTPEARLQRRRARGERPVRAS